MHNWLNKRSSPISFAVPMIWRKPKDNCKDCNFYLIKTKGFFFKQRDKIAYPNSDIARTPVLHDESMPLPVPPQDGLDAFDCNANEDNSDIFISANSTDSEYDTTENPNLFSLEHLNDPTRNVYLSNKNEELLASMLKEQNMVEKNVKVSYYRKRNWDFSLAFKIERSLCSDVLTKGGPLFSVLKKGS